VISGKKSGNVKAIKLDKISNFGTGKEKEKRYWVMIIHQALIHRFLVKEIENYGILKLTDEGKKFIKEPFSIMVAKDHDFSTEDDEDVFVKQSGGAGSGTDMTLFTMLKDLRKEISKEENLPPFVIFQDTSLEDMAIQYPISMEEMQQIIGVGAGKAAKYGQPFLELISQYVEENEITRPNDIIVKSVVNKSGLKVYIIKSIDRKLSLKDVAHAKNLTMEELLTEIERIVSSGTRLDINYYVEEHVDEYHQEDILDYFSEAETDSIDEALEELGEAEYNEEEIRLMRIKYLSEVGN
jgi:ATP-dependent DNA helicase RecQ